MQKQWQEILNSIIYHENELKDLRNKWTELKDKCSHTNLPKHTLREQYSDTCPDCGFRSYCIEI